MSVGTALNNFTQSVAGIFYSLLNAVLAIFHAVLALGNELLTSVFKLFQAVAALVKDLVQGDVTRVLDVLLLLAVTGGLCSDMRRWMLGTLPGHSPLRALMTREDAEGTTSTLA